MATDQWGFLVAKVAEQGQGVSDCSHPDRKSKRTTMMGDGGEGGNFQKPNYFWDGGEKNITVITAPGKSGVEEQEVMEKQWGCTEEVSQRKKKKSQSANPSDSKQFLDSRSENWTPYYG